MLRSTASLAFVLSLAATAHANQVSHPQSFPVQPVPWSAQLQLPLFDAALGVLTGVTIGFGSSIDGQMGLENTSAQQAQFLYAPSGWITSSFPFGGIPPLNPAYDSPFSYALPAYDGVSDFAGTSGLTDAFTGATGQGNPFYVWGGSGPFVASFVGPAGNPGTFTFGASASDGTNVGGLPAGVVETHSIAARATVTVTYTYETFVSICKPGAAGVIACPCGNPLAWSDGGCDNSAGTGGALLTGIGNTTLSADNFRLKTVRELPSALSIVLQGDAVLSNGVVFGQGVRCVGGALRRLYVKTASGGSITAGAPIDASISSVSAALGDPLSPGMHRYYTVYYRDPVVLGGCSASSTFNSTQTLDVAWAP